MRRPGTATWSTFAARRAPEARRSSTVAPQGGQSEACPPMPARIEFFRSTKDGGHGVRTPFANPTKKAASVSTRRPKTKSNRDKTSVEQRVDVILRGMTDVTLDLRAVEQPCVALPGIDDRRRVRLDRLDAAPDIHHHGDVVFDELHRGHHLLDALTGQILEIAGFEDRNHALLDIFAEQLLLIRRGYLGQRARRLIDRFRGLQNLLGGFFG